MDGLGGLLASMPGWLMGFHHHQMNHVSKLRHEALQKKTLTSISSIHETFPNLILEVGNSTILTINCHPVEAMAYVIVNRLLCSSLSPKCFGGFGAVGENPPNM